MLHRLWPLMLIVFCLIIMPIGPAARASDQHPPTQEQFFHALIQIESGGKNSAVGDNGRAVGPLQLWRCYVDDVNRFANTNFTYNDRTDRAKSIKMATLYLQHYAGDFNAENWARCHNSGPKWRNKIAKTNDYWHKVQAQMNKY